jgi:hypothetical protein
MMGNSVPWPQFERLFDVQALPQPLHQLVTPFYRVARRNFPICAYAAILRAVSGSHYQAPTWRVLMQVSSALPASSSFTRGNTRVNRRETGAKEVPANE